MSTKAVRRMKGADREGLIQLRRNMKEALDMAAMQQRNLAAYVAYGQDLYMTCHRWLFTEDVRVDGAKMAHAVELLLTCRKYSEKIRGAYRDLAIIKEDLNKNLAILKQGKFNDAVEAWMGDGGIVGRISAIGEQVAEAILILKPVYDEKLTDLRDLTGNQLMATFLMNAINDAEANLETAKAANMQTPVDPEALAAMEAAMAQAEAPATIPEGESVPVMEEGETEIAGNGNPHEIDPSQVGKPTIELNPENIGEGGVGKVVGALNIGENPCTTTCEETGGTPLNMSSIPNGSETGSNS